MLFFKKILVQPEEQRERRSAQRYTINPDFPLKSVLSFVGRDESGILLSNRRDGWDWKGRLLNFSEMGASMQLAPSVMVNRSDSCELKLRLDSYELVVPCHINNIREKPDGIYLGLKHDIKDLATDNAYGQLLEIVALGVTLKKQFKRNTPDEVGYLMEQYASPRSRLNVWRHMTGKVAAFEFLFRDCMVRAADEQQMDYLVCHDPDNPTHASATRTSEIHRLFQWVLPNLPACVPADVCKFLRDSVP